jgi:hypothetical protein
MLNNEQKVLVEFDRKCIVISQRAQISNTLSTYSSSVYNITRNTSSRLQDCARWGLGAVWSGKFNPKLTCVRGPAPKCGLNLLHWRDFFIPYETQKQTLVLLLLRLFHFWLSVHLGSEGLVCQPPLDEAIRSPPKRNELKYSIASLSIQSFISIFSAKNF